MRGLRGKPFRQVEGIEAREVDGELFLVAPEGGSIHQLDALGAAIWRQYTEPRTLAELESMLTAAFPDANPETIAKDLKRLFTELRDYDLIFEA